MGCGFSEDEIMIRAMQEADLAGVADIWLDTNLKAHHFISPQYWRNNFQYLRELLPQAEVYVWEDESTHRIVGFIGLNGEYISGIFVQSSAQSGGIGKKLLDYVKGIKPRLTLHVYQKNSRAVTFYQREGFCIQGEHTDDNTGETEYLMKWGL